jgi:ABC-type sugar transport system substrate-binding protein
VFAQYTNWDTGQAEQATRDLLNAHPNVKCIWSHSDAIALGAVRALQAAGKTDVLTMGMGMYGGGPQAIAAGQMSSSWYMAPIQTADAAAKAVTDYWTTGKSVPDVAVPLTFVTKENVHNVPWS